MIGDQQTARLLAANEQRAIVEQRKCLCECKRVFCCICKEHREVINHNHARQRIERVHATAQLAQLCVIVRVASHAVSIITVASASGSYIIRMRASASGT